MEKNTASSKPHPPILIFDVDGPLLDSKAHQLAVLFLFRQKKYKWALGFRSQIRAIDVLRKFEAADATKSWQFMKNINAAFREILPNRFWRWIFFGALGRRIRPWEKKYTNFIPGVVQAIRILHQKGCIIGICSSSETKRIKFWLEREHIDGLIPCLTSRDHRKIYGLKPSAGPLLGLLKIMKNHYGIRHFDRDRVAFVGDNVTDMLSAKGAKIKSIAVLSGHGFYGELKEIEPTLILESAADIPKFLVKIFPNDFPS